jgi:hypothetical protein
MLATDVGACECEIVTQEIGEKLARFYFAGIFVAVDC